MAAGARPSWPRKPCEWCANRLRGRPASTTSTRRRARASCIAADSPAQLPPTTAASYASSSESWVMRLGRVLDVRDGSLLAHARRECGEREPRQPRREQRLGVLQELVEGAGDRPLDPAPR